MKKLLLILLILLSLSAKSQIIKRSMVIDSVIYYKKHVNKAILLHRIGPNMWAGMKFHWTGLGRMMVNAGDTAVLVRNDPKRWYHPYVTIKFKEHE